MPRPAIAPDERPDEEEWQRRHRAELARLAGTYPALAPRQHVRGPQPPSFELPAWLRNLGDLARRGVSFDLLSGRPITRAPFTGEPRGPEVDGAGRLQELAGEALERDYEQFRAARERVIGRRDAEGRKIPTPPPSAPDYLRVGLDTLGLAFGGIEGPQNIARGVRAAQELAKARTLREGVEAAKKARPLPPGRQVFSAAEDAKLRPQQLGERYYEDAQNVARAFARRVPGAYQGTELTAKGEDLVQEGLVGFLQATRSYEGRPGIAFMPYAQRRIEGAIQDALRTETGLARSEIKRRRQAGETTVPTRSLDELLEAGVEPGAERLGERGVGERTGTTNPLWDRVAPYLPSLRQEQRNALYLALERNLNLKDIGAHLGYSESGASRLLSSARRQIGRAAQEAAEVGERATGPAPRTLAEIAPVAGPGGGAGARAGSLAGELRRAAGVGRRGRIARDLRAQYDAAFAEARELEQRGGRTLGNDELAQILARRGVVRGPRARGLAGPGAPELPEDLGDALLLRLFGARDARRYAELERAVGDAFVEAPQSLVDEFMAMQRRLSPEDQTQLMTRFIQGRRSQLELPGTPAPQPPELTLRPQEVSEEAARFARGPAGEQAPLGLTVGDRRQLEKILEELPNRSEPYKDGYEAGQQVRALEGKSDPTDYRQALDRAVKAGRLEYPYGTVAERADHARGFEDGYYVARVLPPIVGGAGEIPPEALRRFPASAQRPGAPVAKPIAEDLLQTAAQREAGVLPTSAPAEALIQPKVSTIARAQAAARREAVQQFQAKIDESIERFTKRLSAETAEAKEPSAFKIAVALERRAKEIVDAFTGKKYRYEAGGEFKQFEPGGRLGAQKIEHAGPGELIRRPAPKRLDTEDFAQFKAERVAPLEQLSARIRDTLTRLKESKSGEELRWAKLTRSDQADEIVQRYPELEFEPYRDAIKFARTPADQGRAIDEANAYLQKASELDLGLRTYPQIGRGADVAAIQSERSRLITELASQMEEAARLGVDATTIDPVRRVIAETLQELGGLRTAIGEIRAPAVSEDVRRLWSTDEQLIYDLLSQNPEKMSALFKDALALVAREHPERFEQATARMPIREQLQHARNLAAKFGLDTDAMLAQLRAEAPDRGAIGPLLRAADEVSDELVLRMHRLATEGKADSEDFDRLYAMLVATEVEIAGGASELGRALNLRRLQHTLPDAAIREQERIAAEWTKRLQDTRRDWQKALRRAEDLAAKTEAESAKGAIDPKTQAELEAARARAAQLQVEADELERSAAQAHARLNAERVKALTRLVKKALRQGATSEQVKALMALDPERDFDKIVRAVVNMRKLDDAQKTVVYFLNNLYSSPESLQANTIGNFLRLANLLLTRPLTARTTAPLLARLTGRPQAVLPIESRYAWASLQSSVQEATRLFVRVMAEGRGAIPYEDLSDLSKFELGRPAAFEGKSGLFWEPFLRILSGTDAAFAHVARRAEQAALEARTAAGLKATKSDAEIAAGVARLRTFPTEEWLAEAARGVAAETTYRNALDPLVQRFIEAVATPLPMLTLKVSERGIPRGIGVGRGPWLKLYFTPVMFAVNAIKFGADISGGAAPRAILQARRASGLSPEQALVIDRRAADLGTLAFVGAVLMLDAIHAYLRGDLAGDPPSNPTLREGWNRLGMQRDSRRLANGEWWSHERFWPFNFPYVLVAKIGDSIRDGLADENEIAELVGRALVATANSLTDVRFVREVHRFNEVMRVWEEHGPGPGAWRYISEKLSLPIWGSATWRDLAEMTDAHERDPKTLIEMMERRFPGASQLVRPRVDRWGRPIERPVQGLQRLNPFATAPLFAQDPVDAEVSRLETKKKSDGKTALLERIGFGAADLAGAELSDDDSHRYRVLAGTTAHDAIGRVVATSRYRGMSDEKKAKEIESVVRQARAQARRQLSVEMLGDPDGQRQMQGLRVGLAATQSNYERAKLLETVLPQLEKSHELRRAFEVYKGSDDLTLAQYKQAIPLLKQLEAMPEFSDGLGNAIGEPKIWEQYRTERKEYDRLRREGKTREAAAYRISHPVFARYAALAARELEKNPQATLLRRRFPVLRAFTLPRDEAD